MIRLLAHFMFVCLIVSVLAKPCFAQEEKTQLRFPSYSVLLTNGVVEIKGVMYSCTNQKSSRELPYLEDSEIKVRSASDIKLSLEGNGLHLRAWPSTKLKISPIEKKVFVDSGNVVARVYYATPRRERFEKLRSYEISTRNHLVVLSCGTIYASADQFTDRITTAELRKGMNFFCLTRSTPKTHQVSEIVCQLKRKATFSPLCSKMAVSGVHILNFGYVEAFMGCARFDVMPACKAWIRDLKIRFGLLEAYSTVPFSIPSGTISLEGLPDDSVGTQDKNVYLCTLHRQLKSSWHPRELAVSRQSHFLITISREGRLIKYLNEAPSGDPVYDQSIAKAIQTAKFSPLPIGCEMLPIDVTFFSFRDHSAD